MANGNAQDKKTASDVKIPRKTLEDLFNEPCTVVVHHASMHQSFQVPGGGTESSLNPIRRGLTSIKMVFHPGYGLIGYLNGKYFLTPSANVIAAYE